MEEAHGEMEEAPLSDAALRGKVARLEDELDAILNSSYSQSDAGTMIHMRLLRREIKALNAELARAAFKPQIPVTRPPALIPSSHPFGFPVPGLAFALGGRIHGRDGMPGKAAVFHAVCYAPPPPPFHHSPRDGLGAGAGGGDDKNDDDGAAGESVIVSPGPPTGLVVKVVPLEPYRASAAVDAEVALQRSAALLGLSPRVRAVSYTDGFAYVLMEAVHGMSVADRFGAEGTDAELLLRRHPAVHAAVRQALRRLAAGGIVFPDRTAYNFLVTVPSAAPSPAAAAAAAAAAAGSDATGAPPRIVVVDFEHARRVALREGGGGGGGGRAGAGDPSHVFGTQQEADEQAEAANLWNPDFE